MYQELSGEKIKEYENELAEKLEGKLALKLECKKDYRLGGDLDQKRNNNLISLEE